MATLEQAIVSTLSWFDILGQPLTAFECWYYLWDEDGSGGEATPQDVWRALDQLKARGAVVVERGFWQLTATRSYVPERLARARWSIKKFRRAQAAARLLARVPFVRLVASVNTLAMEGARQESDIDLFIVVRAGRLYLTRLFVTAVVHLLGRRRHGQRVTDRLCLSFYVSDDQLNLKPLAYVDDPYLSFWLVSMLPLTGLATFNRFLAANSWVEHSLPHRLAVGAAPDLAPTTSWCARAAEWLLGGAVGTWLEAVARWGQVRRIKKHSASRLGDGTTAVVVTDSVLKFHETDQRPVLAGRFRARQHQALASLNSA
ncbi:MAG: hypothetical protein U1C53_01010 [Candidatus Veblenbacteria bacterium]|nr:hypothetical protein [Candidatus Veblenbacteria bacterium]MDZ4229695.1 hypothetical protein [Candidatus Veblenbacteria bacterium]